MWIEPCEDVDCFMAGLIKRNSGQPEFHQAVKEFVSTVMPYVRDNPKYQQHQILERLSEPDRVVIFRVTWQDCLLYTSPSPRDQRGSRMPSSA